MPATTARRGDGARAAAAVAVAVLALPACSDDPEQPATGSDASDVRGPGDLEDPYDGPYTADFRSDVEAYAGQEVTLQAAVEEVLSPAAFTITGPDGADVEAILVVGEEEVPELRAGQAVTVAATPQDEFEVSTAEEELSVDLDEETFEAWEGEPYLRAGIVRSSG